MIKYINTQRDRASAEFTQTEPDFSGQLVNVSASVTRPMIPGVGSPTPVVKGRVRVVKPVKVPACNDTGCGGTINSAVAIEFNVLQGDVDAINALVTEAKRCLDDALANYQLANGVIPPSTADFANRE